MHKDKILVLLSGCRYKTMLNNIRGALTKMITKEIMMGWVYLMEKAR